MLGPRLNALALSLNGVWLRLNALAPSLNGHRLLLDEHEPRLNWVDLCSKDNVDADAVWVNRVDLNRTPFKRVQARSQRAPVGARVRAYVAQCVSVRPNLIPE